MNELRSSHVNRYKGIEDPIPGTRSYHQFIPLSKDRIGARRCSDDAEFACVHDFHATFCLDEEIVIGSYAAVVYDQCWWLCLILERNVEERDVQVKFLHPKGPSSYFYWPQRDDVCFVPENCILKIIEEPIATGTGRKYLVSNGTLKAIQLKFTNFLKLIK